MRLLVRESLLRAEGIGETRRVMTSGRLGVRSASGKLVPNKKCYEQTQHILENKGHQFFEPSMSLNYKHLTKISQHINDSKRVEWHLGGRDGVIFVRLEPPLRGATGGGFGWRSGAKGGGKGRTTRTAERGWAPLPPIHFFGLPRNVVDNKGPKMRKLRILRHTWNVYENKIVSGLYLECL